MLRRSPTVALLLGALAACATSDDIGGAPPAPLTAAAPSDLAADSRVPPTIVWDDAGRGPRMLTGEFPVTAVTDEAAARAFLARHATRLGVAADGSDLALLATRHGLAGSYVRFQQVVAGVPVFDRQVVVVVAADRSAVRALNLGQHGPLAAPRLLDRGPGPAIAAARAALGPVVEESAPTTVRGLEVTDRVHLAYRVTLVTRTPIASWEVSIDAGTGEVLSLRDRNVHADGTGLVFDMTPTASTGTATLTDGNDQTNATLDAARFAVTLPRLDGTGVLRGPWVDAMPLNANQRTSAANLAFAFNRQDDRFEEVMAYYHLDRAQARIQALGHTDANNRMQVARVNALTADNSFYSPANKEIRYGTGGVDDAEDADILLHEYGHAIQDDQVPGWGNGDEGSMGEGFGDYLAASFSEVLPAQASHPQPLGHFPCVGDWDATSYDNGTPRCLRRTDGDKHAPEDTDGEVHDDGEIWAAGLWRGRTAVGADVMDRLVLESHGLLTTNETFDRAAAAIVMADQLVFAGSHRLPLRRALYHHGLLRTPQPAATYANVVATQPVTIQNPHNAQGQYVANLDDTQTFTLPGALALRVHFSSLSLTAAGGCDGTSCDNLYLTDGSGDLYQIFTASQNGPRTSVQVPGDTVKLRLVTDTANQNTGYVVDRVEAMGGTVMPVDAAVDAAIDAAIDARPIDAPPPTDARPLDAAPAIDAPPALDAPPATDAATVDAGDPEKVEDSGCCSTGGSPAAPLGLALVVGGLLVRRRRR